MKTNNSWKPVTISGMTGILMGAGAMYAVKAIAGNDDTVAEQTDKLQVATSTDGQSFKDAFDAARAEQGPGGVFSWHGKLFNTYTAEEWNAMSQEEKEQFAQQFKPEIPADDVDESQLAEVDETVEAVAENADLTAVDGSDSTIADTNVNPDQNLVANTMTTSDDVTAASDKGDEDVRVLGYGPVQLDNGQVIDVQELELNGQRVAVIDVDRDGNPDYAMSDLNHNQQADEGEIIDLHTGEPINFTNDETENYYASTDDSTDIDMMPV